MGGIQAADKREEDSVFNTEQIGRRLLAWVGQSGPTTVRLQEAQARPSRQDKVTTYWLATLNLDVLLSVASIPAYLQCMASL